MSDRDGQEKIISAEGLIKDYGDVKAVDGVSFDVEKGTVVGILGPNGAGKTTLIKSVLGLIVPTEGSAEVNGVDVHRDTRNTYRHVTAVLEGSRNIYWRLTVRENLNYFASLQGIDPRSEEVKERHENLIERFGLEDKADKSVKNLSRGMKQKVALACAFARRTPVLFLDEPTLGLDVQTSHDLRNELRSLVEEEDRTVILSSHDMDVMQDLCERVIIMNEGEIVADDTVENLIDVFRTQAYRIRVEGKVSERVEKSLRSKFETDSWEKRSDTTTFEVTLDSGDEFYEVVDGLRELGLTVTSVSSIEPDLEEAFLRITEKAREDTQKKAVKNGEMMEDSDIKRREGDVEVKR